MAWAPEVSPGPQPLEDGIRATNGLLSPQQKSGTAGWTEARGSQVTFPGSHADDDMAMKEASSLMITHPGTKPRPLCLTAVICRQFSHHATSASHTRTHTDTDTNTDAHTYTETERHTDTDTDTDTHTRARTNPKASYFALTLPGLDTVQQLEHQQLLLEFHAECHLWQGKY